MHLHGILALLFLMAAFALIMVDVIYHSNTLAATRVDGVLTPEKLGAYSCPNILGIIPYLAHWCLIIGSSFLYSVSLSVPLNVLALVSMGVQMRALQEISHFSVHRSLCASSWFGDVLANVFFQCPMLLEDVSDRRNRHFSHHQHANTDSDPNMSKFREIGMNPPLSKRQCIYFLFFPLTPGGVRHTLLDIYRSAERRNSGQRAGLCIVLSGYAAVFLSLGIMEEFFALFVVARVFVYPWLSWISLLVEHRWFVNKAGGGGAKERECHNGRPTVYRGVTGEFIRVVFFPYGDSYHLAHSLY